MQAATIATDFAAILADLTMDRTVVIQSATASVSSSGDITQTWSTFATTTGTFTGPGVQATEGQTAMQVQQIMTGTLVTPYVASVNSSMRITVDGVAWDVVGVAPIAKTVGLRWQLAKRGS